MPPKVKSLSWELQQKYKLLVNHFVPGTNYSKFCTLFVKDRSKLGVLVNRPFKKWVKVNNILNGHASNVYHIVADAKTFKQSIYRKSTVCYRFTA